LFGRYLLANGDNIMLSSRIRLNFAKRYYGELRSFIDALNAL